MGIVEEIRDVVRPIIEAQTGHTRLDYEFDPARNSERSFEDRYGFVPGPASFVDGRALRFTTIDHTFTVILTDHFQNQDDDSAQYAALLDLYAKAETLLKELQKSKLALPTPEYRLKLISGLEYEEPQFLDDMTGVILRANLIFNYSYLNT